MNAVTRIRYARVAGEARDGIGSTRYAEEGRQMQTTISARGQTAVPAEIRRRFNLRGSSRLEWLIEGDVITVRPIPADPIRAFRGSLKGRYSGKLLLAERQRDRRKERQPT